MFTLSWIAFRAFLCYPVYNEHMAKKLWCCVVGVKCKNLVLYNKWVDKSRFALIKALLEMPAS